MSDTRKRRDRFKKLHKLRKALKRRPFELMQIDGRTYALKAGSAREAAQRWLLPGDE